MAAMPGPPMQRPIPPSARTAKTLVLVGLILDIVFVLVSVALVALAVIAAATYTGTGVIVGLVFPLLGLTIGILVLFLIYILSYQRIGRGEYEKARIPTLVFAILSIVTLINLLPGILWLIAYLRLGDAITESQQAAYSGAYAPQGYPAQPYAPAAYPAPMAPPAPAPPPTAPACPRCGQPAIYVAQYGRWYCYRDQAYL